MPETTLPKRKLSPSHQKAEDGIKPLWFHIGSEGDLAHRWADGADTYGLGPDGKSGSDWHEMIDPRENVLLRLHEHMRGVGSDLWRVYANLDYEKTPYEIRLSLVIEFILSEAQKGELSRLLLTEFDHRVAGTYAGFDVRLTVMHEAYDAPGHDQIEVCFDILGKSFAEVCALQLRFLNDPVIEGFGGPFVSVM